MIEQEKTNESETKQQLMRMQEETILAAPDTYKEIRVTGLVRVQHTKYHKAGKTYQISMTLGDFFSTKHQVDFWEEEKKGTTDQGYQRNVEKQRAREFARYTIAGNQSYSNYIFSIRDVDADMVDIKDSDDGQTAVITIREGCPIWIVDGSHRAHGLDDSRKDLESNPEIMSNYQMPVSLTIGQTKTEEVNQFITENKMHKGVATDLALHCIYEMLEGPDELEGRKNKIFKDVRYVKRSFKVVDEMNANQASQFKGRLRPPNKKPGQAPETTISGKAFSDSIKPLMHARMSPMHKSSTSEIAGVLINWWNAWEAVCPEPFRQYVPTEVGKAGHDPNDYVIQANIGTQSLNKLLAKIQNDFGLVLLNLDQRDFEQLIDIDEMKNKDNWAKSIGSWSQFGTNQKSFDQISDRMIQMIADQKHQVITKLGGRVAEGE